jgi:carbon-monoxide dehydrogenase catalytic subunit
MGSCVDNSRILEAAAEMVAEGGLGADLSELPAVGVAPEWMSEKAVAIGTYFVASGIDVVLGHPFRVAGSPAVSAYLEGGIREVCGASFHNAPTAEAALPVILGILDERRKRLGLDRKVERKLMDMEDRRRISNTGCGVHGRP